MTENPEIDQMLEIPQEPEDERPSEVEIIRPFDPTKIRVQTETKTIDNLVSRMRHDEIVLQPEFQRGEVWRDAARSRLIESILIRIPLPAFYMDATEDDRWQVIDGQQRLSTVRRFIIDKTLKLSSLEFLTELEGRGYDDLPQNLKRRINETNVTVYLVEQGTPPEVKFNIFRRINTGGLPLSAQEIRHALNLGPATDLLRELAVSKLFLEATCRSVSPLRMSDRECVVRFLAFCLTPPELYEEIEFDAFLSKAMARINGLPPGEVDVLRQRFDLVMLRAKLLFGNNGFRKPPENGRRQPLNKALFESWSLALDGLTRDEFDDLRERKEILTIKYQTLFENITFHSAISQGTGDVAKVKLRFREIRRIVRETLDAQ